MTIRPLIEKEILGEDQKSNWYSCWMTNPMIKQDKTIIEKYFNNYTSLQQKKLTEKFKKDLKQDLLAGKSNISLKQIPELTLALKQYRQDDISYPPLA